MELSLRDIAYERELLRPITPDEHPSRIRIWLTYINLKKSSYLSLDPSPSITPHEIASSCDRLWAFYDRALESFPRSYKLWSDYCDTRSSYIAQFLLQHEPSVQSANGTYERALLNLWICPRLWLDYFDFLRRQNRITLLRKTMNKALQSLPITQHDRLWESYLPIVRHSKSYGTVADAYRRFLQLHPEYIEDACEYFVTEKATKFAAFFLTKLLNDPHFESLNNRNKYYWWSQLSSMISIDPDIENAKELLLNGCRDFVVETGRMWVLVGELFARLGRFADAIQTFEDALNSTTSARDFTVVFEGAAQLLLSVGSTRSFRMYEKKLNDLLDRRELLLNRTLLRENVHNVECWIQRVGCFLIEVMIIIHGLDCNYGNH
jgi:pre-mRNA-splicing factor SYF1